MSKIIDMKYFSKYKEQVLNRAAHSIQCEPSDLNSDLVEICFAENKTVRETAHETEHALMQEFPK